MVIKIQVKNPAKVMIIYRDTGLWYILEFLEDIQLGLVVTLDTKDILLKHKFQKARLQPPCISALNCFLCANTQIGYVLSIWAVKLTLAATFNLKHQPIKALREHLTTTNSKDVQPWWLGS